MNFLYRYFIELIKDQKIDKLLSFVSVVHFMFNKNKKKSRGKSNDIFKNGAFIRNTKFTFIGDNNTIIVGKRTLLNSLNVVIIGSGHKLTIHDRCIISNSEFWFEDTNCEISIGTHTRINGAHIAVTEPNSNITIGSDCLFSKEIDIRNGDSHSIIDRSTMKRINFAQNIYIGNHVWLSKYVKVLKGSNIGDNCVIGMNSIVSGKISSNSLTVGSPVKIVKENITWDIERIYT